MAEGGYDPDDTNPFDPNEGSDEKTPLFPEGTEMKHRFPPLPKHQPVIKTSTSKQHVTSFIDNASSSEVYTDNRKLQKEEIERRIKAIFHKPVTSRFFSWIDEYDRVMISLTRSNAKKYELLNSSGELAINLENLPKGLRDALGKTFVEINDEEYTKQQKEEEEQAERVRKYEKAKMDEAINAEELLDCKNRLSNLQGVLREQLEARNKR